MVLCANRGDEINGKTPYVEGVDKRDDPLQDGSRVPNVFPVTYAESNGQCELHENKSEFNPEGNAKDAVFAVMYSETLVFPADEDGRDNVTTARNLLAQEISA